MGKNYLKWESDWNGDEVGFPDVPVVGLYSTQEESVYVNTENGRILDRWSNKEEEEE